jgi:hypothetical protein
MQKEHVWIFKAQMATKFSLVTKRLGVFFEKYFLNCVSYCSCNITMTSTNKIFYFSLTKNQKIKNKNKNAIMLYKFVCMFFMCVDFVSFSWCDTLVHDRNWRTFLFSMKDPFCENKDPFGPLEFSMKIPSVKKEVHWTTSFSRKVLRVKA